MRPARRIVVAGVWLALVGRPGGAAAIMYDSTPDLWTTGGESGQVRGRTVYVVATGRAEGDVEPRVERIAGDAEIRVTAMSAACGVERGPPVYRIDVGAREPVRFALRWGTAREELEVVPSPTGSVGAPATEVRTLYQDWDSWFASLGPGLDAGAYELQLLEPSGRIAACATVLSWSAGRGPFVSLGRIKSHLAAGGRRNWIRLIALTPDGRRIEGAATPLEIAPPPIRPGRMLDLPALSWEVLGAAPVLLVLLLAGVARVRRRASCPTGRGMRWLGWALGFQLFAWAHAQVPPLPREHADDPAIAAGIERATAMLAVLPTLATALVLLALARALGRTERRRDERIAATACALVAVALVAGVAGFVLRELNAGRSAAMAVWLRELALVHGLAAAIGMMLAGAAFVRVARAHDVSVPHVVAAVVVLGGAAAAGPALAPGVTLPELAGPWSSGLSAWIPAILAGGIPLVGLLAWISPALDRGGVTAPASPDEVDAGALAGVAAALARFGSSVERRFLLGIAVLPLGWLVLGSPLPTVLVLAAPAVVVVLDVGAASAVLRLRALGGVARRRATMAFTLLSASLGLEAFVVLRAMTECSAVDVPDLRDVEHLVLSAWLTGFAGYGAVLGVFGAAAERLGHDALARRAARLYLPIAAIVVGSTWAVLGAARDAWWDEARGWLLALVSVAGVAVFLTMRRMARLARELGDAARSAETRGTTPGAIARFTADR